MEHSGTPTNIHNVCYSPLRSTVDPSTNNFSLLGNVGNDTSWSYTRCCLPDVSVSKAKEEKVLLQYKTLWVYGSAFYYDNFSCRTYRHGDSTL